MSDDDYEDLLEESGWIGSYDDSFDEEDEESEEEDDEYEPEDSSW